MVDHPDWFQYKYILPRLKKAKKAVQKALKPGGGGTNSSRIGKNFILHVSKYISRPSKTSICQNIFQSKMSVYSFL